MFMKKLLLISILAVLIGCKKDAENNAGLNGSWEYRGAACYCVAAADTSANKPGNGNILSFTNSDYKRYTKGVLEKSGTYTIIKATAANKQIASRIIYDGDTTSGIVYFRIDSSKLTLFGSIPLAADGPEYYYERIKL
jgi:hypothetical protein